MAGIYTIDEIRSVVNDVSKKYGVKKVALFGSYSDGNPTEDSDIDLLIEKGNIRGLIMFNAYVNDLRELLNKNVDVLTYSSLNSSLIKDAVKNEVVLYEQ